MSNRVYTVTLQASGDLDEAREMLDAYIAGLKARMHHFMNESLTPEGPEAIDAPSLNPGENCIVTVTLPNFVAEEGVNYYLCVSEDDWNTFAVVADGLGPNDSRDWTYGQNTKFRIRSNSDWGQVDGPSTNPIP